MSSTVVATDLDGTVLFSGRAIGADPVDHAGRPASAAQRSERSSGRNLAAQTVPVDVDGPRTYAFMTAVAARRWRSLAATGAVVPATTRSLPQYRRLRLPGPPPRLAVVCNGGRLLVDGEPEPSWERTVRRSIAASAASFGEVWRRAAAWRAARGFAALRAVDDFFVYLTVARREGWLTGFAREADEWGRRRGWRASLQGRKLYLIPTGLDKAPAVAEAAARLDAARVVAGGDSLLDAAMLRAADAAIRPAHGELHVTGFTTPHCRITVGRGAAAGDEILDWYAGQVDGA